MTEEYYMRASRRSQLMRLVLACLLALFLGIAAPTRAEEGPTEYQIKAAFLVNFANFTTWPDSAFFDATAPLVIGILGDDPFNGYLDAAESKSIASGRRMHIVRGKVLSDLTVCSYLFVCASEENKLKEYTAQLGSRAVLTIGDTPDACRDGAMICFFSEANKIRFRVNFKPSKNRLCVWILACSSSGVRWKEGRNEIAFLQSRTPLVG